MPLHREVERFLQAIEAAGGGPLDELPLEEVRQRIAGSRVLQGDPVALARVEDLPLPARLYSATGEAGGPVVAFFHGGGWAAGDLDSQDPFCRALAAELQGIPVVSVGYRQPPEHPYPAAVEDALAALEWLAGTCGTVAVAGSSAGGNLAAAATLLARERGGPAVRAQVLHCPVLDCDFGRPSYREFAEGYWVTRRSLEWFWSLYVPDPARRFEPTASPLRAADLAGLPPALVQTAEFDPLRDEGEAYARRLEEAGVPVRLTRYEGHVHDPWGTMARQPGGRASLQEAARFLRAHL